MYGKRISGILSMKRSQKHNYKCESRCLFNIVFNNQESTRSYKNRRPLPYSGVLATYSWSWWLVFYVIIINVRRSGKIDQCDVYFLSFLCLYEPRTILGTVAHLFRNDVGDLSLRFSDSDRLTWCAQPLVSLNN